MTAPTSAAEAIAQVLALAADGRAIDGRDLRRAAITSTAMAGAALLTAMEREGTVERTAGGWRLAARHGAGSPTPGPRPTPTPAASLEAT